MGVDHVDFSVKIVSDGVATSVRPSNSHSYRNQGRARNESCEWLGGMETLQVIVRLDVRLSSTEICLGL